MRIDTAWAGRESGIRIRTEKEKRETMQKYDVGHDDVENKGESIQGWMLKSDLE